MLAPETHNSYEFLAARIQYIKYDLVTITSKWYFIETNKYMIILQRTNTFPKNYVQFYKLVKNNILQYISM